MVIPKICKLMLGLLLLNCFNNSNASMQENNNIINSNTSNTYLVTDRLLTFFEPFEKLNVVVNTIDAIMTLGKYPIDNEKVNRLVDMNYDKRNASNLVCPLGKESQQNNDLRVLYNFKNYQEHKREALSHWVKTTIKDYLNNTSSIDANTVPKIETMFKYLTFIAGIENNKLNNIIKRVSKLPNNKKTEIFYYIVNNFQEEIAILASDYDEIIQDSLQEYLYAEEEIQDAKEKIDGEIYDKLMKECGGDTDLLENYENKTTIQYIPIQEDEDKIGKGFCRLFGGEILPYLNNLCKLLDCISCPNNK